MLKILIFFSLFLTLTIDIFGQTNQITGKPKRVVYTRKSVKADYPKRNFEVRYPIVTGVLNAVLKRKIENTINY
jgi:hypothetical protein